MGFGLVVIICLLLFEDEFFYCDCYLLCGSYLVCF